MGLVFQNYFRSFNRLIFFKFIFFFISQKSEFVKVDKSKELENRFTLFSSNINLNAHCLVIKLCSDRNIS